MARRSSKTSNGLPRKHYSSEEKIRIVLDGLRGEDSIAELCRREGISQSIYYKGIVKLTVSHLISKYLA